MAKLLQDRVALVTGAGSGIGRAIAYSYAAEGAAVVVSDVAEDAGAATVAHIIEHGGRALFVRADSSKPADQQALVDATLREFGALHVATNNAGVGGASQPVGEHSIEAWDRIVAINLSGVFYGMRYQIPALLEAGGGCIVNIASILGQVGLRNTSAYVAAKHGVVGLTQTAALEYAARKIRINAVGPGFIRTPLIEGKLTPATKASLEALHPIGRMGEAQEVAELVLWLSTERASFVTGSYYPVDGGYLAQ